MAKKKITLAEILEPNFGWALAQVSSLPIPARSAFQFAKIFRIFKAAEKEFMDVRHKTMMKYVVCEPGKDGVLSPKVKEGTKNQPIWLEEGSRAAFEAEITEAMKEEIEYDSLTFQQLGDDIKIPSNVLIILEKVITQEDSGPKLSQAQPKKQAEVVQ